MEGDANDAGDDFGQAMRICKQFGIAETIDDQHANDGAEIENDFRRLLAAAKGGEDKATDCIRHEKHDDDCRPKI